MSPDRPAPRTPAQAALDALLDATRQSGWVFKALDDEPYRLVPESAIQGLITAVYSDDDAAAS